MAPRLFTALCASLLLAAVVPGQDALPQGEFVVRCGKAFLGEGRIVENVWITVRNGKVAAVSAERPAGNLPVLDARDKVVMPGIVAADSRIVPARDDAYNVTPDVMAVDGFDFQRRQKDALAGGVTTAYLSPGRERLVSGQGAVVKLHGDDMVARVLRDSASLRVNLGDGATKAPRVFEPDPDPTSDDPLLPARVQVPTARISVLAELRRLFADAASGVDEKLVGPGAPETRYDESALAQVLAKKLPLRVGATTAQEVRQALQLQRELGCTMVLEDPVEFANLAAMAANQAVGAVFRSPIGPGSRSSGGEVKDDKTPRADLSLPAKAAAAGVSFALAPSAGSSLRDYLLAAGLAVRGGLAPDAALRAITGDAAKLLGVADRVGTLAPGKDADLVLLSGDPLAIGTMVEATWVDGTLAFRRESSTDVLAIRAGRIMDGEGRVYRNGVVLVGDGVIKAVGEDLAIPYGARILDLPDGVMTPGFVDAFSHLGLAGDGTGVPQGAANQPVADVIDPADPMLAAAAAAGLTTVLVSGKDGGPVAGRIAAVKTGGGDRSKRVLRAVAGQRFQVDGIGPDAARGVTEALERGRRYSQQWKDYEKALADFKAGKAVQQQAPEPTPAPAAAAPAEDPVSGTWEATLDIQGRFQIKFVLELKLDGTKVTGTTKASFGGRDSPAQEIESGSFENGELKISLRMGGGGGQSARLEGKIENDTFTGKLVGGMGEQELTGKRTAKGQGGPATGPVGSAKPDDGSPKKPDVDESLEPVRAIVEGRGTAVVRADRAGSVQAVVKALGEAKVSWALHGGEGMLDDTAVLAGQKPAVLLEPEVIREDQGKLRNIAAVYGDMGLPVSFGSGECAGAANLPLHVAYAVRYGLSPEDAMLALTRRPAQVFQLDDRIGSLRKGKDADLVVFSGNPFETGSRVLLVVINGSVVVDRREEQTR